MSSNCSRKWCRNTICPIKPQLFPWLRKSSRYSAGTNWHTQDQHRGIILIFWATRNLRIILGCWFFNSVCKNIQMYTGNEAAVKSGFRVSFTLVKMRTHRTAEMYPGCVCFYLMMIPCIEWKLTSNGGLYFAANTDNAVLFTGVRYSWRQLM